jgi:zinc protease
MIYLNFTDPRIDPEPVTAMMDQYATSLTRRDDNPGTVFSDEVNGTMNSNHPRFKHLELADLAKADINAALAFLRSTLNPGDYTFVFTGNLNAGIMKDYVETYIASIPLAESRNEWTDLNVIRPGKIEKTVYKGKEDQSQVFMEWFAPAPYTEELSAATRVLREYLDITLEEEIREKRGGVYSIYANITAWPVPRDELLMYVYFVCDPGRVEELSAAVIDLLNSIAGPANGVDRDIFGKAAEALKKEWEISLQSNSYIAQSYANSSVLLRASLSRLEKRPQYFEAVTPADLERTCTLLLQNGPARVLLRPEQ